MSQTKVISIDQVIDFAEQQKKQQPQSNKQIAYRFCRLNHINNKLLQVQIEQKLDNHFDLINQIEFEEKMYTEPINEQNKQRVYEPEEQPNYENIKQPFRLNSIAENNKKKIQDQLVANGIEPLDEIVYSLGLWVINSWHTFSQDKKVKTLEFMIEFANQLNNDYQLRGKEEQVICC